MDGHVHFHSPNMEVEFLPQYRTSPRAPGPSPQVRSFNKTLEVQVDYILTG